MSLKLMYITNQPEIAVIAETSGVDRIFVDMEYIGKSARQGGMDTVQCHHTVEDVKRVRKVVKKAQLMVRVNPIHDATTEYCSSEEEINAVIDAGADIIMLPYFQSIEEIERFVKIVKGRAIVLPLLESKKSYEQVDAILKIEGIDQIHIGINDLSLEFGKKFMFELLADGTVEGLCQKFKEKGIPYGFGGIGRIGKGDLPAENIIMEHYRLGSECAILSRSFCNVERINSLDEIKKVFDFGVAEIRNYESMCAKASLEELSRNKYIVKQKVQKIVEKR